MQSSLFKNNISGIADSFLPDKDEVELVCFRDLVPEIKDTSYLTHSIYYYPAKFIPHVVRFCLMEYTERFDTIVDPFAGSGTVGLEAYLTDRNSYLLDLNPLLDHIIPIKIARESKLLDKTRLADKIDIIRYSRDKFVPNWENYEYWYPPDFLDLLVRYWGGQKSLDYDIYSRIIEASLVRLSKHFSLAEHRTPKLFRSKSKIRYVNELLTDDWRNMFDKMLYESCFKTLGRINQLIAISDGKSVNTHYYGGVDSAYFEFGEEDTFDALITSPPYLQAQEYIRTVKMDLYWLGFNDADIKILSQLEIPYRKNPDIITTPTLDAVRGKLERDDLINLLNSYFYFTIKALENAGTKIRNNGKMLVFIGNPKVDGIEVEIWRILNEYFSERGYVFVKTFEDRIKSRQLFGGRKNKNPDGMKSEYLLVMEKE